MDFYPSILVRSTAIPLYFPSLPPLFPFPISFAVFRDGIVAVAAGGLRIVHWAPAPWARPDSRS